MATTTPSPTLYVIGSGPGIGRAVAQLFSAKRYANVALFARNQEQLKNDSEAVMSSSNNNNKKVQVRTYPVDVTDSASLSKALDLAEQDLGKPDCVFYNAARVLPSKLLEHDVGEIEYDFKINVSALYLVAQRYVPHLLDLAQQSPQSSKPALIVTSSLLPKQPIPQVFALSLVKAAQRNLMQSLYMTYGGDKGGGGVHIGVINVGGPVSPDSEERSPTRIAEVTWQWLDGAQAEPSFEVDV
ncbi:uncharacterized protein B0I36DRAFT_25348 [Microdochium trichocladiopsis]|uniref:Uncharacterized protein n=1 Tax=Microdochium trichocladiopsis TaxID=1682393 RepID=A0A9P9BKM8_9PEZI|nr:uncharacterized protein B0I36DRAFT_25348 [Microdochium trichocladiopsis]KAH7020757.1 hypothetical protein B0I36DRAFT_25348 [Microdochium trichocladiopsis]